MTLKEWRIKKGWSQGQFVEALNGILEPKGIKNVWQSHVSNWEKGVEPRRQIRDAIHQITHGKVKADSYVKSA